MGGVNYFPNTPIENNTEILDKIIEEACLDTDISSVTQELMVEILKFCGSNDANDFDNTKFISSINALSVKRPNTKYRLIVRYNRDISKGTGTLLSPNDRLLGDRYNQDVVLTLYRNNGSIDKGWSGQPLWIPNIKFPEGYCFYDAGSIVNE